MKISLAQFSPCLGDPEGNRRTVERLALEARGCDLLVLPELCHSGYNFSSREEAWEASEPVQGGLYVTLLHTLSRTHRMFIVSGLCEREGEKLYNSAVIVGPKGVVGLYRKLHLFLNEKDFFTPGDLGLPVFDLRLNDLGPDRGVGVVRIGVLICFDWQFPETWRVLALRGAEVVCHPANLVLPGRAQRAVPLHAMLNRISVALANRIGTERGLRFTGESIIVAPSGEILAQASAEEEEILRAEVDPAASHDKMVTPRNDLIRDRRPEFYGPITEPVINAGSDRPINPEVLS